MEQPRAKILIVDDTKTNIEILEGVLSAHYDVYVAKDNVFQAKETLKSIIENYPGGEPKELAQQKLAAIEKEELKNEEAAE